MKKGNNYPAYAERDRVVQSLSGGIPAGRVFTCSGRVYLINIIDGYAVVVGIIGTLSIADTRTTDREKRMIYQGCEIALAGRRTLEAEHGD